MAIKKSEIYSSLWASCDELRGGMDASQYKDYILTLLFLKYVSDKFKGVKYAEIEIGVIPEDWEVRRLGEVLAIKYGKSQAEIADDNGKFPILGTGGIVGFTNRFLYDKPSIIIGRKGSIDKPQYIDNSFWTIDTAFYTEVKNEYDGLQH